MSHFVVSARKYRPSRFAEVVGQESVTQTLRNAFSNDSLAHAFLFCGPRGVGKTSCARILAQALNCTNRGADQEPCGSCDSCSAFQQSASLNIIELDAASNNSVEHIRSLNEQVRFQPQEGTSKVFIIDEVHMLSQAAFNAFLKTLEEPPPYAYFILATTEKHKIIPTILSRCQIFDFKRISVADLVGHLQEICKQESIDAEEEALHLLATKADGALRDALSLFDKLVSFGGKKITYQDVVENLNLLDYDYFFRMTEALIATDNAGVLALFGEIIDNGFEGDAVLVGLAQHMRNLLVCKHQSIQHLLDMSPSLHARYAEQSVLTDESYLLSALELLNQCDISYRMAKNKRLHVELALIKLTHIKWRFEAGSNLHQLATNTSNPVAAQDATSPDQTKQEPVVPSDTEAKAAVEKTDSETLPEAKSDGEKVAQAADQQQVPTGISAAGLGSLTELVESVAHEQLKKQEAVARVISLDDVQNSWNAYMQLVESPTIRAVLEKTELKVKNNAIVGIVASPISRKVIQQENNLIEKLREDLGVPKLSISIEVDPSRLEDDQPRVLTVKEKYEYLCQANPIFKQMVDSFGLKIDH